MSKDYKKPEFKTVVFEAKDVITTSDSNRTPEMPVTTPAFPEQVCQYVLDTVERRKPYGKGI